jgi:hypothetical protein
MRYVKELSHERRFSKWRENVGWTGSTGESEEDAIEAIGALRDLLATSRSLPASCRIPMLQRGRNTEH